MTPNNDVFLVDTRGVCFLCLKWVSGKEDKFFKTFSYRTLARYLSLNFQKVFGSLGTTVPIDLEKTANFNVKLCPDCYSLAVKFSDMYKEKELIRLRISHCAQQIHSIMTQAGRVRSRVKHYKKMMTTNSMEGFDVWVMENLRKETMERCVYKLKNSLPKVHLVRTGDTQTKSTTQEHSSSNNQATNQSLSESNQNNQSKKRSKKDSGKLEYDKATVSNKSLESENLTRSSEKQGSRKRKTSLELGDHLEEFEDTTSTKKRKDSSKSHSSKGEEKSKSSYPNQSEQGTKKNSKSDTEIREGIFKSSKAGTGTENNKGEEDDPDFRSQEKLSRKKKKKKKRKHSKEKHGTTLVNDNSEKKERSESLLSEKFRKDKKHTSNSSLKSDNKLNDAEVSAPVKRGRGRPRKKGLPASQPQLKIKPVTISLPRMARTVISKYKRETRSRAQEDKEKSSALPDSSSVLQPPPPSLPIRSLFSCHFCAMKFSTAQEVRKHCSKFHYCQLFFSSFREANETDEEFKNKIDVLFETSVRKRRGKFGCPYCTKLYVHMRYMRAHCAQTHYNNLREDIKKVALEVGSRNTELGTENEGFYKLQCEYCDQTFNQSRDLRLHTARSHCDQLFASFKSGTSDHSFNDAIEQVFDHLLSRKPNKCTLCPSLQLNKGANSAAHWRLHVINTHFQDFGNRLGQFQTSQEVSERSVPGNSRAQRHSKSADTLEVDVDCLTDGIPDYIQNIGSSVDKNGRQTDFYYCCLCKKTIDGIAKLENHKLVHSKMVSPHRGKSNQCKHCDMKFASNRSFHQHAVENHLLHLLSPYRNSHVPEKVFLTIIEQNFENLLQQSGSSLLGTSYKCNYCVKWNVTKEKADSLKLWRTHLVANHFDDFTRKLVELQKDQETELEAANRRSTGTANLMSYSNPPVLSNFDAPFLVPAQELEVKSDVVHVDVTDHYNLKDEFMLQQIIPSSILSVANSDIIEVEQVFQYQPSNSNEVQPMYMDVEDVDPVSNSTA